MNSKPIIHSSHQTYSIICMSSSSFEPSMFVHVVCPFFCEQTDRHTHTHTDTQYDYNTLLPMLHGEGNYY